jgi:hypothetical protein
MADFFCKLRRVSPVIFALILLAPAGAMLPATARAQEVALPKEGMQYFTFGLSLNPGFIYDPDADQVAHGEGARGGDGPSNYALGAAGMAEVGITQIINRRFFMSAEAQVGLQWLNEHTADKDGSAPSSTSFAWQLGLYMQWLPLGEELGFVSSAGLQLFRVRLDDAPLQILGAEFRLGKYIWTAQENFLLVHVGYTLPFIEGLSRPTEFDSNATWAEEDWTFHRFSLGFQYGF